MRTYQTSYEHSRYLLVQLSEQSTNLPIPLGMLVPLISVCQRTAADWSSPQQGDSDEAFYLFTCLRMLQKLAPAYKLVPFVMQGIMQVAVRRGVALPEGAIAINDQVQRECRQSASDAMTDSPLPIDLDLIYQDKEMSELQRLIEETAAMTLDSDRPRETSRTEARSEGRSERRVR